MLQKDAVLFLSLHYFQLNCWMPSAAQSGVRVVAAHRGPARRALSSPKGAANPRRRSKAANPTSADPNLHVDTGEGAGDTPSCPLPPSL